MRKDVCKKGEVIQLKDIKIIKTPWGNITKYLCKRCNRYFRNLNLHDKTSRCGRVAGFKGGLGKQDIERIEAVGIDIAIKRNKP